MPSQHAQIENGATLAPSAGVSLEDLCRSDPSLSALLSALYEAREKLLTLEQSENAYFMKERCAGNFPEEFSFVRRF